MGSRASQPVVRAPMETRSARRLRSLTCAICLQPGVEACPDACGGAHWFHTACLLQWCEVENTCPTCRQFFNYVCPRGAHRIYVMDRVQEDA